MTRRVIGALVMATFVSACESQALFESCQMNERMQKDCAFALLEEQCEASQTSCYATCAILDHPQCVDGPCMIYQYRPIDGSAYYQAGPFCTSKCDPKTAGSCPADGECRAVLGGHYCVPKKTVPLQ